MDELVVVSLGAGVQSSALALLAVQGRISPRPTVALFADTRAEWPETYEFLFGHLQPWLESRGLPVVTVSAGNMYNYCLERGVLPVVFGSRHTNRRQCTVKFKIRPAHRWLREQGIHRATVLLGISADESHRAKPAREWWLTNEYPLVNLGLTRLDCMGILREARLPVPPKSRCFFCPMQPADAWRLLAARHPQLFERAVELENRAVERRVKSGKSPLYLLGGRPLREMFTVHQLSFEGG